MNIVIFQFAMLVRGYPNESLPESSESSGPGPDSSELMSCSGIWPNMVYSWSISSSQNGAGSSPGPTYQNAELFRKRASGARVNLRNRR